MMTTFGNTGLTVSKLGFGAGHIGSPQTEESDVALLLNKILDAGINFIDTARGYGLSEERIGRILHTRRNDFVLSTKVGYGIEGYTDWTYDCIIAGVHRALQTLHTDYIDIVHLHSCPMNILQHNGVIDALLTMKEAGKILVAAYSGENESLHYAARTEQFGSVQTSINVFDQYSKNTIVPQLKKQGCGIIAKRPLANCPWQYNSQPFGMYAEQYWLRMHAMQLDFGANWLEIAIRFAAWHCGADTVIAGSQNASHFLELFAFVQKGPLDMDTVDCIERSFIASGTNWMGEV